jgi:hypothetical protein
MKTTFTCIVFFIVSAFLLKAQIPNASFENWTGTEPNGWTTYNGFPAGLVTQSSDAHTGSSAIRLNVVPFIGSNSGGSIWSASAASSFYFPVSSAPMALHGWFKFHSTVSTESFVVLSGTKSMGAATASAAGSNPTNTLVYTEFIVNYNYIGTPAADSAFIFISLTEPDSVRYGTYAIIDDLSFGPIGPSGVADLNVDPILEPSSPNPASEFSTIIYRLNGSSTVSLCLYDLLGKKIMTLLDDLHQGSGHYKIPTDISNLPGGIYFYHLTVNGQLFTQKLMVAK